MTIVIVDTSLVVKWVLNEVLSPEAQLLKERWIAEGVQIAVSSWFCCEVANVFFQSVRAGRYTLHQAETFIDAVLRFVTTVETNGAVATRALHIADAAGQKATYDAFNVSIAEHLGCELWTADERFWRTVSGDFPFVRWLGNVTVS